MAEKASAFVTSKGISGRCDVITGSFFDGVPTGIDAYILKQVIHDWPDNDAVRILKSCRKSMTKENKLLVLEFVIDEGNNFHPGKWFDLHMMVVLGGKERTQPEFAMLFKAAGFKLERIIEMPGFIRIIEGIPV